jgi:hypothetical protein
VINFFSCYDGVTIDMPTYHKLPPTVTKSNTNILVKHSEPIKIPGSIDEYPNMTYTSSIVFSYNDSGGDEDDIEYMIWYTTVFLPVQEAANRACIGRI